MKRINTIPYPKGSIIVAEFDKMSEYYYLNKRPLIVITTQIPMFDTLSVVSCGSKDRPGIKVGIYDHRSDTWFGEHDVGIIFPYNMYTVRISQIVEFHGVIDPFTMKALDKAIDFHRGLTDEIPPYMEEIYKEIYEPQYNMANESTCQIGDPHPMLSDNERSRRKYFRKTREQHIAEDRAAALVTQTHATYTPISKPTTISIPPVTTPKVIPSVTPVVKPTEVSISKAILTSALIPEYTAKSEQNHIGEILSNFTDEDLIKFIIRTATPGRYGKLIVTSNTVRNIRCNIEQYFGLRDPEYVTSKLNKKLGSLDRNFMFLSDFEQIVLLLYSNIDEISTSKSYLFDKMKIVIAKYDLDFSDGRKWRGLDNKRVMYGRKVQSTFVNKKA